MRRIRLVVEYDGSQLSGWQRQANAPTVQQHLEETLAQLLQHPVQVAGASRTDAGVHARGQVCAFSTEKAIPLHGIRRGMNSLLPDTIAVRSAEEVAEDFHPRFQSTGKHYRYTILNAPDRSPRWRNHAWHHSERLDLELMREGARHLIGEHDFAAFRAAGCAARTTTRRISDIQIGGPTLGGAETGRNWSNPPLAGPGGVGPRPPAGLVAIDVRGNAFLRNMVRILVGTLVEVGTGARPPAQVAEILAGLDRTRAGKTAPPQGLELMEVRYDGVRPGRPVAEVDDV
ncbi:MAG TPA: tRNA pseudouridine(38-40) synthase TruA [Kofleriaceae bacterium]